MASGPLREACSASACPGAAETDADLFQTSLVQTAIDLRKTAPHLLPTHLLSRKLLPMAVDAGAADVPAVAYSVVDWGVGSVALALLLLFLWEVRVFLQPCSRNITKSRLRLYQAASVVLYWFRLVEYTAVIPVSLGLATATGFGPGMSGLLVGIRPAARVVGAAFVQFMQPWMTYRLGRLLAVSSLALAAALDLVAFVLLASMPPSRNLLLAFLTLRTVVGVIMGVTNTATNEVRKITPDAEQLYVSLGNGVSLGFGLACGPLICGMLLAIARISGFQDVFRQCGIMMLGLSVLTVFVTWLMAVGMPPADGPLTLEREGAEEAQEAATGAEKEQKKEEVEEQAEPGTKVTNAAVLAMILMTICTVSGSAVEVSASMMLEVQYGWSEERVGVAMGLVLGPAVLVSIGAFLYLTGKLPELTLARVFLAMGVVGAPLLFDVRDWSFGPWQLLLSDVLLYPSAMTLLSVFEATAFVHAAPGTLLTTERINLLLAGVEGTSALVAPGARLIISVLGRNAYAGVQCGIVIMIWIFQEILEAVKPPPKEEAEAPAGAALESLQEEIKVK